MNHNTQLRQIILERINREGPITFARFMEMALYHPDLGYYAASTPRIGKEGDFYTSPHTHALFGAMLGRQMEEMWQLLGRPSDFTIVEMGAGAGYLALDMLDHLRGGPLYDQLRYVIIEPLPASRTMQQDRLAGHAGKVDWRRTAGECGRFTGCFFSNELLDALPVRLVETADGLREVLIGEAGGELVETMAAAPSELAVYLDEFGVVLEPGYRTEVNLSLKEWVRDVSGALETGFVLSVDYGYPASEYYSRERNRGTLLAYRGHRVSEDFLTDPGGQDLTAHVNFSALKKWGEAAGLETLGFAGQGAYLVSLGIHELMPAFVGDPPDPVALSRVKQLIMPQGLGETHKVMIQAKHVESAALRGFTLRNELSRL